MENVKHNFIGIANIASDFDGVEIDSIKFNNDANFNKPINEISQEIQKRKNRTKVTNI